MRLGTDEMVDQRVQMTYWGTKELGDLCEGGGQ